MSTMSTTGPAVLICGREICGTGTGRYVSFRLTLPNNLHHASPVSNMRDLYLFLHGHMGTWVLKAEMKRHGDVYILT